MSAADFLRHDRRAELSIALALLAATYLAFSVRTILDPVEPGELLSAKRLVTAAVGATMFWLLATRWDLLARHAVGGRLWRGAVLVFAAMGPVLATRVGYDLLVTRESDAILADNVRWIIAWSGYFIAAVLGHQLLKRREAPAAAWDNDDYMAHLVADHDDTPVAYEIRR